MSHSEVVKELPRDESPGCAGCRVGHAPPTIHITKTSKCLEVLWRLAAVWYQPVCFTANLSLSGGWGSQGCRRPSGWWCSGRQEAEPWVLACAGCVPQHIPPAGSHQWHGPSHSPAEDPVSPAPPGGILMFHTAPLGWVTTHTRQLLLVSCCHY